MRESAAPNQAPLHRGTQPGERLAPGAARNAADLVRLQQEAAARGVRGPCSREHEECVPLEDQIVAPRAQRPPHATGFGNVVEHLGNLEQPVRQPPAEQFPQRRPAARLRRRLVNRNAGGGIERIHTGRRQDVHRVTERAQRRHDADDMIALSAAALRAVMVENP